MSEPLSNLQFVPEHLASKPGKYTGQDVTHLVGKFVKMGFKVHNPISGQPHTEHMWVKVERVEQATLVGTLDNDPIMVPDPYIQCGDTVTLTADQIEDVLE